MSQAVLIGTLIDGRYRILSAIGSGGYATVYKAEQTDLNRVVAMKFLDVANSYSEQTQARFEREVKVLAGLDHPNIVKVYGCGVYAGQPYLVMEHVEGVTLAQEIQSKKKLTWQHAADIGIQICKALSAAHQIGIVHRDISPRNIMLTESGSGQTVVKVLDFGLSLVLPGADWTMQKLTRTGTVLGTVLYMSPEAAGGSKAEPRSDIYSLGCVLYECLNGSPPFPGENPADILRMQFVNVPPPIPDSEVPKDFQRIILKALAKQPAARFESADQFADALQAVRDGRTINVDLSDIHQLVRMDGPRRLFGLTQTQLAIAGCAVMGICIATWYLFSYSPSNPIRGNDMPSGIQNKQRADQIEAALDQERKAIISGDGHWALYIWDKNQTGDRLTPEQAHALADVIYNNFSKSSNDQASFSKIIDCFAGCRCIESRAAEQMGRPDISLQLWNQTFSQLRVMKVADRIDKILEREMLMHQMSVGRYFKCGLLLLDAKKFLLCDNIVLEQDRREEAWSYVEALFEDFAAGRPGDIPQVSPNKKKVPKSLMDLSADARDSLVQFWVRQKKYSEAAVTCQKWLDVMAKYKCGTPDQIKRVERLRDQLKKKT